MPGWTQFRVMWRRLLSRAGLMFLITSIGVSVFLGLVAAADAVLFRTPFPGAENLVIVLRSPQKGSPAAARRELLLSEVDDLSAQVQREFAAVGPLGTSGGSSSEPAWTPVSLNFFRIIGIVPVHGRLLGEQDDATTGQAVISEELWESAYGRDPDILGRSISASDRRFVVVGVVPRAFRFPKRATIWTPLERNTPVPFTYQALTKLDGPQSRQALASRLPTHEVLTLRQFLHPAASSQFVAFLGAGALLLTLMWLHVALMFSNEAFRRADEFRLRMALGATRNRIAAVFLGEAVFVLVVCTTLGAALAPLATAWISRRLPLDFAVPSWPGVDGRFLFAVGGVVLAGAILLSLTAVPIMLYATRTPGTSLGQSASRARFSLGAPRWFVAVECAVCAALVHLMALTGLSLGSVMRSDLGFDPEVLTAFHLPALQDITQPGALERRKAQYSDVLLRVSQIRGVDDAAIAGDRLGERTILTAQVWMPEADRKEAIRADHVAVSRGYFATLGLLLTAGRVFEDGSQENPTTSGLRQVVVDTTLADAMGGSSAVLGRHIRVNGVPAEVVGVAAPTRSNPEENQRPRLYSSVFDRPLAGHLLVRSAGGTADFAAVGASIQTVFGLPRAVTGVPLASELEWLQSGHRARFQLMSLAGWLGIFLTTAGIYGLSTIAAAERSQELAIRTALGATQRSLAWIAVRIQGFWILLGLAVGVAVGFGLGRIAASLLYLAPPTNAATTIPVVMFLAFVGVMAAVLPLSRSSRLSVLQRLGS